MATPKRAVVLRLAELEKYPTTRARYEATLPFEADLFPCSWLRSGDCYWHKCKGCDLCISFAKRKADAIKQTEKRWVWFSEARKLDDTLNRRLGTLGYLPLDIREMIWCAVIGDYKKRFGEPYCYEEGELRRIKRDEKWLHWPLDFAPRYLAMLCEGDTSRPHDKISRFNVFDLRSYYLPGPFRNGAMDLRLASPQLKIELESACIFRQAFRFFCPRFMDHFLNQLSAHHRPLLRSITMVLHGCCDSYLHGASWIRSELRAWVAVIERLPATLQFVTFEVDHRRPQGRSLRKFNTFENNEAVLELMTKKVRRQAHRAKISVVSLTERWDEDREMWQDMLDELEPFSEEFEKWSDQSRKNAMD